MKKTILFCFTLFQLVSCQKHLVSSVEAISMEKALSELFVEYEYNERSYAFFPENIHVPVWPEGPGHWSGSFLHDSLYQELTEEETIFRRGLSVGVPKDQAGEDRIEAIHIGLTRVVDKTLLDEVAERFKQPEDFHALLLTSGDANEGKRLARVAYHDTYFLSDYLYGNYPTTLHIDNAIPIVGNENAFLVSGTFETHWDEFSSPNTNLTNGKFSLIFEN